MSNFLSSGWHIYFLFPAGCEEYDNTLFDMKNSTFGQAPGTEIVISCSRNMERDVTITCQEDGQWEPNPNDLQCIGIISLIKYSRFQQFIITVT